MRVPLESLVLQIKALNVRHGDPFSFPFIQPPPKQHIEAALLHLQHLGVVTEDTRQRLTPLGVMLSNLPVDVGVGKLLVVGALFQLEEITLVLSAMLSVQSPFKYALDLLRLSLGYS